MTDSEKWVPEPTERQEQAGKIIARVKAMMAALRMLDRLEKHTGQFDEAREVLRERRNTLRGEIESFLAEGLRALFDLPNAPYTAADAHARKILLSCWQRGTELDPELIIQLIEDFASGPSA